MACSLALEEQYVSIPNQTDAFKSKLDGLGKVPPYLKSSTAILNFALLHRQPTPSSKEQMRQTIDRFTLNTYHVLSKADFVKNGGISEEYVKVWCVFFNSCVISIRMFFFSFF